jgi:hypothetical protein
MSLFHPTATSRIPPVQGFLPPHSRSSSHSTFASMLLAPSRFPSEDVIRSCLPQLRGLTPYEDAFQKLGSEPFFQPLPSSGSASSRPFPHTLDVRSRPPLTREVCIALLGLHPALRAASSAYLGACFGLLVSELTNLLEVSSLLVSKPTS